MKARTREFALRIFKAADVLPTSAAGKIVACQLVKRGSSVGASYRSAFVGRSQREFRAKLGIAREEADEACYWLEPVIEGGLLPRKTSRLLDEANQLTAILTASIKTTGEAG